MSGRGKLKFQFATVVNPQITTDDRAPPQLGDPRASTVSRWLNLRVLG